VTGEAATAETRVGRRRFLAAALGLTGSVAVARARPWSALVRFAPPPPPATRLAELLTHRDSARVVGKAYLERVPAEASASRLVDQVAAALPAGHRALREASDADLRSLLEARIRADFEDGKVVDVDGWVLAPTEARLYALTTFS
jgi:hypothetical protein